MPLDTRAHERRAPICPGCGVTALPIPSPGPDTAFICENPDCEQFEEVVG